MGDQTMHPGKGNLAGEKKIYFKFFLDGANAPAAPAALSGQSGSPLNDYITSFTRVSQGIFRLTLAEGYLYHVATLATLNVSATGQARYVQGGPVANFGTPATPATVDILIVDGSGAVQDPAAANSSNFISGCIVVGDIGNN